MNTHPSHKEPPAMPGIDISPDARALLLALFQPYLPGVTVWAFGSRVKGTTPPDNQEEAVQTVLQQAEALGDAWV